MQAIELGGGGGGGLLFNWYRIKLGLSLIIVERFSLEKR